MFISFKRLKAQGVDFEVKNDGILIHFRRAWRDDAQKCFGDLCEHLDFKGRDQDTLRGEIHAMQVMNAMRRASDI